MKQLLLMFVVAAVGVLAWAAPTNVTFTDGSVSLKPQTGAIRDLQIGDSLKTGDTIRTGKDGTAELDQNGVTLKINASTVFTLMEKEQAGQKRSVVGVSLGSVKMKYDKLTGQEPLIKTAAAQAGVRGTELTVYSGDSGASLITVDKGQVDVTAEGKTVALVAGEGVEVQPGQAPGIKFVLDRSQTDYSKWNDSKVQAMLADPVAALASLKTQLDSYVKLVGEYDVAYKEYAAKLMAAQKEFDSILEKKGKDEALAYRTANVDPLMGPTSYLIMNERFEALAALSLRRYVAGRLAVLLKPQLIMGQPVWGPEFQKAYDAFLSEFEQSITPVLVTPDI